MLKRCSHLYESGQQCSDDALPESGFCIDHETIHDAFEPLVDHPFRKLLLKVAAGLLLIAFLIPFYYTVKSLYLSQTTVTPEVR
jgi:hypothetical protein